MLKEQKAVIQKTIDTWTKFEPLMNLSHTDINFPINKTHLAEMLGTHIHNPYFTELYKFLKDFEVVEELPKEGRELKIKINYKILFKILEETYFDKKFTEHKLKTRWFYLEA